MEQAKYDEMQGMLNKLEDIKNSQESIIDKINHVITDLFQNPDKDLEKSMESAHQKASDNVDAIKDFVENFDTIRKDHRNEQEYLSWAVHEKGLLNYWPTEWCPSYKYDCVSRIPFAFWKVPEIPEGAKIIIFHGEINPHKAIKGGRGKWYRYVRPAKWVANYWK